LTLEPLENRNLLSFAWNVVPSPNPFGTVYDPLNGVAAVAENDVWAVGEAQLPSSASQTLTEHWNGTAWSIVPSPNPPGSIGVLNAVAAVASNNVWAVGHGFAAGTGQTLIEHWNGASWNVVPSPSPGATDNELRGVVAVSATDVWAVGFQKDSSLRYHTLTEHWNGIGWTVVPSLDVDPSYNFLYAVTASSGNDVWAVGSAGRHGSTLVEHWDGLRWSIIPSPPGGYDGVLYAATTVSPTDVWAVGTGDLQPLTEHWDGTSWSIVPSPSPGTNTFLTGVAARGSNDLWAVGNGNGTAFNGPFTEHWDGASWSIVPAPSTGTATTLNAVAALSGGTVWSVGLANQHTFTMNLRESGAATHLNFLVPPTITAGTPFTLTVQALDAMNQVATGYTGTVHFVASNGAMANYTFTTGDMGQHSFPLTLYRAQPLTVTGTDTVSGITGSITFTVNPAAADHLAFAVPDTVTAGVPFSITVTVQDAYGNTVTGFTDTVHFMASNGAMANYMFTAADAGQHTFNIVLMQPGPITITGADTDDPSVTGSISFTVNPPPP
jgi:hypothetical protein